MKNIKDCFEGMQDITPYLKGETQIDEGLRDILNTVKAKFQQAWSYLKGIVTKIGTYFLPTNDKARLCQLFHR